MRRADAAKALGTRDALTSGDTGPAPFANRMRLPLAVFDAMRAVWPANKPLGVRVSSTDWMEHTGEPSWTLDETVTFVRELKKRGVDWIDASTGGCIVLVQAIVFVASLLFAPKHGIVRKRALSSL